MKRNRAQDSECSDGRGGVVTLPGKTANTELPLGFCGSEVIGHACWVLTLGLCNQDTSQGYNHLQA